MSDHSQDPYPTDQAPVDEYIGSVDDIEEVRNEVDDMSFETPVRFS